MIKRQQLQAAAEQGIIQVEQIESLYRHLSNSAAEDSSDSQEPLRFVRGVGDIFITLGVLFVAIAAAQISMGAVWNVIPVLAFIAAAEWLVKGRRLVLPGIAVFVSILYYSSEVLGASMGDYSNTSLAILIALSGLFYWRYRLPFTLLPVALATIALLSSWLGVNFNSANSMAIVYGLVIFAIAMWLDSRDVDRKNTLSDSAFWLHLLAAPLIVHGVMFTLLTSSDAAAYKNVAILLFFTSFFLLALYVDRRALLVSSLSYAIYAVVKLSSSSLFQIENLTLFAFVGLGLIIVVFGVYWQGIRNLVFSRTGDAALSRFVPVFERV